MNLALPHVRRRAFRVTVAAMFVATLGLANSIVQALPAGTPPTATIVLTPASSDSGTAISMSFAAQQSCPGDANAGFRWHTFITPLTNDPATLVFSGSGVAQGPAFTGALRSPVTGITNQLPTLVDAFVVPPSNVLFAAGSFSALPPGDYWIGIACTNSNNTPPLPTERFWSAAITIAASTGAGPNNFTITAATTTTTTSTTTTTTSTTSTTSTTVAQGTATTTTSAAPTGSTTVPAASTTSVASSPSSTTPGSTVAVFVPASGGSPSGTSYIGPTNTLAETGSSPLAIAAWGILLLVLGRMAILLGRKPKVLPPVGS